MLLDTYAYTNRLRQMSPEHKLIFSSALLFAVFVSHGLVLMLIFVWVSVWIVLYAKIPLSLYLKLIGLACVFLLMSLPALIVGAAPAETAVGWKLYIDRDGAAAARDLLFRSMAATSCLYFIMLTTPFAEIMGALRGLRLPGVLLDMMSVMYRFIFVLIRTAGELWIAQMARGGHFGFMPTLRDAGRLVVQLFVKTMHHYRGLQIGLYSRGFSENIEVLTNVVHHTPARYKAEAVLGFIALIGIEWTVRGRL